MKKDLILAFAAACAVSSIIMLSGFVIAQDEARKIFPDAKTLPELIGEEPEKADALLMFAKALKEGLGEEEYAKRVAWGVMPVIADPEPEPEPPDKPDPLIKIALLREAVSTFKHLDWWTAERDPTSQQAIVRKYGSLFAKAVATFDQAILECESRGVTDIDPIEHVKNAGIVGRKMWNRLDSAAEKSLAAKHFKAAAAYVKFCTEELTGCLLTGEPPPAEEPDWVVTQLSESSWDLRRFGDVAPLKVVSSFPISQIYGADSPNWYREFSRLMLPGDIVEVSPGAIPHDTIAYPAETSDPITTIRAAVAGGTLVRRNPVGGSDSWYHRDGGHIRLAGFVLEGDDRAAFKTENPGPFSNIELIDCAIVGGWDATTDTGPNNKWAQHTYGVGASDFPDHEFGFVVSGQCLPWQGGVRGEHFGYHHNLVAPGALFEGLRVRWCGRTFLQFTNRENEGPNADGRIVIRDCEVWDVCLESGGGGSALTFKGHRGKITVERTSVFLGCNQNLHHSRRGNITGAFVAEHKGRGPCADIRLRDCRFETGRAVVDGRHLTGEGSARRSQVNLDGFEEAEIWSSTFWVYPGGRETLRINTRDMTRLVLDDDNDVRGRCLWVTPDGVLTFNDPDWDGSGYREMLEFVVEDSRVTVE